MDWQLLIVGLCIAAAALAVGRRAWRWLRPRGSSGSCGSCGSCSASGAPPVVPLELPGGEEVDGR